MMYLSLLFTAFLAGSFIPLGSEVHLLYLQNKGLNIYALLLSSSIGNTLGGMSCYYIALFGGRVLTRKYLKHSEQKLDTWSARLEGKSEWVAFFCWLPIVGEIIASVLGLLKSHQIKVWIYMFLGKLLRYSLVLWLGKELL